MKGEVLSIETAERIAALEKENKILRENAEHNDKVVDKANWEKNLYKSRNEKAIKRLTLNGDIPAEKYEWVLNTTIYEAKKILQGDDTNE